MAIKFRFPAFPLNIPTKSAVWLHGSFYVHRESNTSVWNDACCCVLLIAFLLYIVTLAHYFCMMWAKSVIQWLVTDRFCLVLCLTATSLFWRLRMASATTTWQKNFGGRITWASFQSTGVLLSCATGYPTANQRFWWTILPIPQSWLSICLTWMPMIQHMRSTSHLRIRRWSRISCFFSVWRRGSTQQLWSNFCMKKVSFHTGSQYARKHTFRFKGPEYRDHK